MSEKIKLMLIYLANRPGPLVTYDLSSQRWKLDYIALRDAEVIVDTLIARFPAAEEK